MLSTDTTFLRARGSKENGRMHIQRLRPKKKSQQALPDLICQLQMPVGTAGLHLPAPDPSGHCRTSSASSRCQWALPDLNREPQIAVGTAGLEPRLPDPRPVTAC
eukprot:s379_g48.t1